MKQSYVPPHKRNESINEKPNYNRNENRNNEKINNGKINQNRNENRNLKKKEKLDMNDISQFPEFGNNKSDTNDKNDTNNNVNKKMLLSDIFKKSLNKQKVKKTKMKKGWIHLTKNGIIDSLTPEERKKEDEEFEKRIYQMNLHRICEEREKRLQFRREHDHTYLWEELRIVDEYEDIDEDEESEYDSNYEEFSQSEDDFYENYNNKEMW
jgi:hypothetical protein